MDPFKGHPLIFEAKIPLDSGLVTGEKPEDGKTIANVDPDFGAVCSYVLRLAIQTMWGSELEKNISQPCLSASSLDIG